MHDLQTFLASPNDPAAHLLLSYNTKRGSSARALLFYAVWSYNIPEANVHADLQHIKYYEKQQTKKEMPVGAETLLHLFLLTFQHKEFVHVSKKHLSS